MMSVGCAHFGLYRNRVYFKKTNMKEVAVKEDEYRVWWCSLFGVFMGGVVVCNDPFNIDLWCPAYSGSLSWKSVRLVLNKLWPRFLLLLSLLFLCLSVSCFLISRYNVIIPHLHLFWVVISLLKYHLCFKSKSFFENNPICYFFRLSKYEIFWYTHNLFIIFYIILMVHMVG